MILRAAEAKPKIGGDPYTVKNIIPKLISYTKLSQILNCLIKEYGYTVSSLLLIIESIENHGETADIKELAGKAAETRQKFFKNQKKLIDRTSTSIYNDIACVWMHFI